MEIRYCKTCDKFTFKEICGDHKTDTVRPAKFSPEDQYGKYRREAKKRLQSENSKHKGKRNT